MPYIPPPRPPPAPRPPVFRPPPPPGPSIQQQQMRQLQQQQQQFRQQQQIRHFQQTQQQLVANQNRLQMERNRQQQQQFQRQQQEHFRRQQQLHQDNLRRQQQLHQDQVRGQQQFHQTQQDQLRRQQQLLQGFQTSQDTASSSVFISPAITLELSGVSFGHAATEGANSLGHEYGPPPLQASYPGQPFPSAPPPIFLQPQLATPTSPTAPGSEFPPPYTGPPPPPQPQQFPQAQPLPPKTNPSPTNEGRSSSQPTDSTDGPPQQREEGNQLPKKSRPAKNKIILRDGTCITIRSKEEYLFVGPHGHQMVINCLPLFIPRVDALQGDSATSAGATGGTDQEKGATENVQKQDVHNSMHEGRRKARRGTKAARRFVLKKASSNDNLLSAGTSPKHATMKCSSEAEDILDETVRNKIEVHRDRWTHFNSSYQQAVDPTTAAVESDPLLLTPAETQGKQETPKVKEGDGQEGEREGKEEEREGDGEVIREMREGDERDGGGGAALPTLSDGGSDGEGERELRVSYIENPEQVETLKRSSGSVSFIGNARPVVKRMASVCPSPPPSVTEDVGEMAAGASDIGSPVSAGVTVIVESGEGDEVTGVSGDSGEGDKVTCVGGDSGEGVSGVNGDTATTDGADTVKAKVESGKMEPETQNATLESAPFGGEHASGVTTSEISTPSKTLSGPPLQNFPPATPSAPPQEQTVNTQLVTPLPPAPLTFEPEFIERSGWLIKLSHRRGVFGDKWQKRYFVLHGSWIYYFKKYGDSIPRGVIRLHPGAWVKSVSQGTARQSDAVAKTPPNAVISVVRCFGVHRPDNFASSLSNLLSQDGVADVFRSQTISISNMDSRSRTFYMIAPSNEERDAWVDAIDNNVKAHALSPSALETSCKELSHMLRAIKSHPPSTDLSPLLALLHSRTRELGHHGNNREH